MSVVKITLSKIAIGTEVGSTSGFDARGDLQQVGNLKVGFFRGRKRQKLADISMRSS